MAVQPDTKTPDADRTGLGVTTDSDTKDHQLPENAKHELDKRLDEGVEESFPGSDPVSVKITK